MMQEYIDAMMREDVLLTSEEFSLDMETSVDLLLCTNGFLESQADNLAHVTRQMHGLARRKLFVIIRFDRTEHDAAWWRGVLGRRFAFSSWEVRPGFAFGEAIPITRGLRLGQRRLGTGKRRPLTPEWAAEIERIREHNNRLTDAFSQLGPIYMWESIDDQPADMHIACHIVEYLPINQLDAALTDIARLSRKAVMITIVLDHLRTARWWRQVFERRFRTADVQFVNGMMIFIGSPVVNVDGVTAVGAVAADDRWEQIKAASQRFPDRIIPAPAHDFPAILACYGPSLAASLDRCELQDLARETRADVFSVSGAHDYLLHHGITPHYHIECDPRAHKADNIAAGNTSVIYLLASACHPVLFDKLEGQTIKLWHVSTPEHAVRMINELGEQPRHVISGGGSVGLRAIPLLYAMGYRKIFIFGMDCSFSDDGKEQHAGPHAAKPQQLCRVECGTKEFTSSPVLLTYATNFFETVQKVTDLEIRLYGNGLLQEMARYFEGNEVTKNVKASNDN